MTSELGIVEGFYGPPWTWEQRRELTTFLAPHGYRTYFYAPKGDPYLRRHWQELRPPEASGHLAVFAAHCDSIGVRLGIGLSPLEAYVNFDAAAHDALRRKLAFYDELGISDVAILFDDMRGDIPDLAQRQAEILNLARAGSAAERLFMCPTYYSDDPVLDRVFGARPRGYLEALGAELDPAVHVFWTGEEIVSRELSVGHLRRVREQLRRKPFLWDNYPVNDTARMSGFLHLRAFTGRRAECADHIAGHFINPAVQPVLTQIPALTLVESYRRGAEYAYGAALERAAAAVLGRELAACVEEDLHWLQDVGLEALTAERAAELRKRYERFDHPAAREIVAWLDGEYHITDEEIHLL